MAAVPGWPPSPTIWAASAVEFDATTSTLPSDSRTNRRHWALAWGNETTRRTSASDVPGGASRWRWTSRTDFALDEQLRLEDEMVEGDRHRPLDRVLDRYEAGFGLSTIGRQQDLCDRRVGQEPGLSKLGVPEKCLLGESSRRPEEGDRRERARLGAGVTHGGRIVNVMDELELRNLVNDIRQGACTPDEALSRLRKLPFTELGYAKVDHHRALRQGLAEAVYGPGKTAHQCAGIVAELIAARSGPVLLTRATEAQAEAALERSPGGRRVPAVAEEERLVTVSWREKPVRPERILVCSAGTADEPVVDECMATLAAYGFVPGRLVDCGVAGVHRLLASLDELAEADVVVVVAGMEGALASLVAGLTPAPVIAVPTSTGYGAALGGITALLAMHASCAAGITVVGIDNGYGAGCAVARILR